MELLRGGCVRCRAPGAPLCRRCLDAVEDPPTTRVRGVGPVPSLFAYAGAGAEIVQALKFRDGRRAVHPLAGLLAAPVAARAASGPVPVAVTWVPTTAARRRDRGFDQAELLARALAGRLGLPALATLTRRPGPAQTGRDRAARTAMAGFTVRARRRAALGPGDGSTRPPPGPVLVVDDVCTTGATLRHAVAALAEGGLVPAGAAVVARTP